jgi:tetratricopeptide (TPR) repeat protein
MGGDGHLPVMADAERALGRPERAIDLSRSPEARDLEPEEAVELLIVVSGARRDLGEHDAAVVGLQVPELDASRDEPWVPRLFYAYAEALQAAGRTDDAVRAFLEAARADVEGETDAEERAIMLGVGTGEVRTDEQTDATDATDHPDPAGDAEDERPAEDPADTAGSRG